MSQDLSGEIHFFDKFLEGSCWDYHKQAYFNLKNPATREREFPKLLKPYLEPKRPIKLLEIGCGGCSNLAWGVDQGLFEITATDPAGDKYAEQLLKYNFAYPIIPIKMAAEDLPKHYPEGTFDIIYARNSLDHTTDPRLCISNAVKVLKKGGILFIEGFVKEGTYTNWKGLHQFDFYVEGNDLVCNTKEGKKINLTEGLAIEKVMSSNLSSIKEPPEEEKYTIVFRKK